MKHGYTPVAPDGQSKSNESPMLWFLLACGCVGLFYVLYSTRNASQTAVTFSEKPIIQSSSSPAPVAVAATLAQPQAEELPKESLFVPNDYLEAELPGTFTLRHASNGVRYELDLGDGHRKPFKNGKLMHTYARPGKVKVTLYGTFNGATKMVDERDYDVARAAEVEVVARIVDFN
ncbi:MAG: hypothetical protein ACK4Q5_08770 [Saprospiraceae bacterium]